MDKKIITFTMSLRQSQFEVDRLEEEAKKLGVEVNRALYRELSFDLKEGPRVFIRGEEITEDNTLGMWFRVAGTVSGKYTEGRNLAIRLLQDRIFCANHEGYLGWARMGKIAQHAVFLENQIPVVPTKILYQKSQVESLKVLKSESNFGEWNFPIVVKHERGYQGKSVRKFENWYEVEKFLNKIDEVNLGMFLWQKYLPTKWDIRVIVLDGRAIGAMKRTAVGKEFRSNYSLGGLVEPWNLSEADKILAEKVARVCGLDYCGVDIMKGPNPSALRASPLDRGDINNSYSYILEVNRQCQFKGFEEATGINVAKAVVEMFLGRSQN